MARLSIKLREKKRRNTVAKFKSKRAALLEVIHDQKAADEDLDKGEGHGAAVQVSMELGWGRRIWLVSLSPAISGERAEAVASASAEGEGRPLVPT